MWKVKIHSIKLTDTEILLNPEKSSICGNGCGIVSIKNGTFYLRGILSIVNEQLISRKTRTIDDQIQRAIKNSTAPGLTYSTRASKFYGQLKNSSCLFVDECIYAGEDMLSPNKCFRLIFRENGDLVIVRSKVPSALIWNTKTRSKDGTRACMLRNGHFVMFNKKNWTVWSSDINENIKGKILRTCIEDKGQLVTRVDDKVNFVTQAIYECV